MANEVPFRIYQLQNKAKQPAYVFLGKSKEGTSDSTAFYPHQAFVNDSCSGGYLFSALIGSRNIQLTPASVENEVLENGFADADPFVYVNSRWYHYREWTVDTDKPADLTPTNFIKTYNGNLDGDYIIQWRSLTSDGSILIKPSLASSLWWDGSEFISDEDAFEIPSGITSSDLNDDNIKLKTLRYVDLVRNSSSTVTDSISLIHKKYQDECLWKSTYLLKKLEGTSCIRVDLTEDDKSIEIALRAENPHCECGCPTCDEEFEAVDLNCHYQRLLEIAESSDLMVALQGWRNCLLSRYYGRYDQMNWLEQFEYNWLSCYCYNAPDCGGGISAPDIYVQEVDETVSIGLGDKGDRQSLFYGIHTSGVRMHHQMPSNYSYKITHKLIHPDLWIDDRNYPRFATKSSSVISGSKINDGKERVVVPPGVMFRTYKSITGTIFLNEPDVITRRPDEFHYALDPYGNVLGTRTEPFPGIIEVYCPIAPGNFDTKNVSQTQIDEWIQEAWQDYFSNGKTGFVDQDLIELIYQAKLSNYFYHLPYPCNGYRALSAAGTSLPENQVGCAGTHTYVNIHQCPIWIDKDIFVGYAECDDAEIQTRRNQIWFNGLESSNASCVLETCSSMSSRSSSHSSSQSSLSSSSVSSSMSSSLNSESSSKSSSSSSS
jgi:hypothetical protein